MAEGRSENVFDTENRYHDNETVAFYSELQFSIPGLNCLCDKEKNISVACCIVHFHLVHPVTGWEYFGPGGEDLRCPIGVTSHATINTRSL